MVNLVAGDFASSEVVVSRSSRKVFQVTELNLTSPTIVAMFEVKRSRQLLTELARI